MLRLRAQIGNLQAVAQFLCNASKSLSGTLADVLSPARMIIFGTVLTTLNKPMFAGGIGLMQPTCRRCGLAAPAPGLCLCGSAACAAARSLSDAWGPRVRHGHVLRVRKRTAMCSIPHEVACAVSCVVSKRMQCTMPLGVARAASL